MLLLAGAVAVAATSCDKDDDNNAPDVNGTYQGSVMVMIGGVPVTGMDGIDTVISVATKAGKTELSVSIPLPGGAVLPVAIELTDLAAKNFSETEKDEDTGKDYTVNFNGTAFKIANVVIPVTIAPSVEATFTLSGGDIKDVMETDKFTGYSGAQGEVTETYDGKTETGTQIIAVLAGTVTGLSSVLPFAQDGSPVTIMLMGEK